MPRDEVPLTPEEIARIETLAQRFRWRLTGRGALPGRAAGRRLGSAGEFEGYRSFEPGDDLRRLDPRVYARLRQPVARVLREDSSTPVTLLIDGSASMTGDARARSVHALVLFFARLARRQGDPLRLFGFREGQLTPLPLASPSPHAVSLALGETRPRGRSDPASSFRRLPPDPAGRGAVIVISDAQGITDPGALFGVLARRGLPFWFAPLDREELSPSPRGPVLLVSREDEPSWQGDADATAVTRYRERLQRYHAAIERHLRHHGGDFVVIDTDSPLLEQIRSVGQSSGLIAG